MPRSRSFCAGFIRGACFLVVLLGFDAGFRVVDLLREAVLLLLEALTLRVPPDLLLLLVAIAQMFPQDIIA
ncbi:MAG: hypothetical protein R6X18_12280 [Chloroflexota bacterium]